jgi:hypothetical protein
VCRVSGIFNRVLSGFVVRDERAFLRIYSTVREYGTNISKVVYLSISLLLLMIAYCWYLAGTMVLLGTIL